MRYCLSITADTLPAEAVAAGKKTFRSLRMEGEEIEFSDGFTELHTQSYQEILSGGGFRISVAKPCIQVVHDIRHAEPIGLKGDYHPLAKLPLSEHPFGW